MKMAIEKELKLANLQVIDITVTKIIQLFETKNSRSASTYFHFFDCVLYKLHSLPSSFLLQACSDDCGSEWQWKVCDVEDAQKHAHQAKQGKEGTLPECQGMYKQCTVQYHRNIKHCGGSTNKLIETNQVGGFIASFLPSAILTIIGWFVTKGNVFKQTLPQESDSTNNTSQVDPPTEKTPLIVSPNV